MNTLYFIVACVSVSSAIGFVLGFRYRTHILEKELRKIASDAMEVLQQHIENRKYVHLSVHREGDTFFVYNDVTQEFLAQGKNLAEVSKVLKDRFPDTHFTIDPYLARSVGFQ